MVHNLVDGILNKFAIFAPCPARLSLTKPYFPFFLMKSNLKFQHREKHFLSNFALWREKTHLRQQCKSLSLGENCPPLNYRQHAMKPCLRYAAGIAGKEPMKIED